MARITYESKRFGANALAVIRQANRICEDYAAQGYDLTLRQLYYQFVSRDLIPNKQSEYKRLGQIINDARMAGRLDWDYIVDRTRKLEAQSLRLERACGLLFEPSGSLLPGYYRMVHRAAGSAPTIIFVRETDNATYLADGRPWKWMSAKAQHKALINAEVSVFEPLHMGD